MFSRAWRVPKSVAITAVFLGMTSFAEATTVTPSVAGQIEGVGTPPVADNMSSFTEVSLGFTPVFRERRTILEFDLSGVDVAAPHGWWLTLTNFRNTVGLQDVTLDLLVYQGNGLQELSDFDGAALHVDYVHIVSFNPGPGGGPFESYAIDVSDALLGVSGYAGFRLQWFSAVEPINFGVVIQNPVLTDSLAATSVPEPPTLVLAGVAGVVSFGRMIWRRPVEGRINQGKAGAYRVG